MVVISGLFLYYTSTALNLFVLDRRLDGTELPAATTSASFARFHLEQKLLFLNLAKVPHTYVNSQPSFERQKNQKHFPEYFSSRRFLVNFNHTSLVRFLYFNSLMNGVPMTTGDECDDLNYSH